MSGLNRFFCYRHKGHINSLFFGGLLFLALSKNLQAETIYQAGYTDFAPMCWLNEEGHPEGMMVDVMSHLLEANNVNFQYNYFPPNRLINHVASGQGSQIQFTFKDMKRFEGQLLFDDEPVFELTLKLYWLPNKNRKIEMFDDIKGASVILTDAHDYFGLRNKIIDQNMAYVFHARDIGNALDMLKADRAEYLLSYDIFAEIYQEESGVLFESLPLDTFKFFLSVHKSAPDAELLIENLGKTLKTMKSDGTFERYLNKSLAFGGAD